MAREFFRIALFAGAALLCSTMVVAEATTSQQVVSTHTLKVFA